MTEFMIEQKSIQRLAKIKATRPNLNIVGTAYYVSNKGDDRNDGLTPETAWKTIERSNENRDKFKPGDAVLFRCGDIFRGSIKTLRGLTYSSYGDGEKPHLYASPFDAAKVPWTDEGNNVYSLTFDKEYPDIGNIVFNHGEAHGIKKWYHIGTEVEFDLDFYHDKENHKFYLKSYKGRPNEVWDSIELCVRDSVFEGRDSEETDDTLIDGLVLKYSGGCCIDLSGASVINNIVRNCEVEWVGGSIMIPKVAVLFGNGYQIWGSCDGVLIENCYFNQCYDAAVSPQWHGPKDSVRIKNFTVKGCLFERNIYDFEYFLDEWQKEGYPERRVFVKNSPVKFYNILFEDNICRKTGYGFGSQRCNKIAPRCVRSGTHSNYAENFYIKNNIFDRSENLLLEIYSDEPSQAPVLEGNVYCQHIGKNFIDKNNIYSKFTPEFFENNTNDFPEKDATIIFAQRPLDR